MRKIKIGNEEFEFKLTLESWKKLKKEAGITPHNVQAKLDEDVIGSFSYILFYGLLPKDREIMTQEKIDSSIDMNDIKKLSEEIKLSLSDEEEMDDGSKK